MKKESNINIRVDRKLKEDVENLFEPMGLNVSTAVNMFFNQCLIENKIPFDVKGNVNKKYNTRIRINKELIPAERIDDVYYFKYNEKDYAMVKEKVHARELCLYPGVWKIENRGVMPSHIHYEMSMINEYKSKGYDKLIDIKEDVIKILVLDEIFEVTIHPNGSSKKILLPEDLVNNIHIVRQDEFNTYIKYIDEYKEFTKYKI